MSVDLSVLAAIRHTPFGTDKQGLQNFPDGS